MLLFPEEFTAYIFDPHIKSSVRDLLVGFGIRRCYAFLTHEHYDHTNGLNDLRGLMECESFAHELTDRSVQLAKNNRPMVVLQHLKDLGKDAEVEELLSEKPYVCKVDNVFGCHKQAVLGSHMVEMWHTPGHSPGSTCYVFDDEYLFTGDSLIPDKAVITSFPKGNANEFLSVTVPFLRSCAGSMRAMPGHGEPEHMKNLCFREDGFYRAGVN